MRVVVLLEVLAVLLVGVGASCSTGGRTCGGTGGVCASCSTGGGTCGGTGGVCASCSTAGFCELNLEVKPIIHPNESVTEFNWPEVPAQLPC